MSKNRRHSSTTNKATVRIAGRQWPVLGRMLLGRRTYLILQQLGHAGRERYMAYDPHAGPGGEFRSLLILPPTDAAWQHVRVLKRVSTGNINLPQMLDYRRNQQQLIIVTDWIKGPDLAQYLAQVREGQVPRPSAVEAFRLIRGLAHGLAQLHRRRTITHGDLKPSNLVLARNPSRLVMIDYGSAWLTPRTRYRPAGDGLSRIYAAPELQTDHQPLPDSRSDQFSASSILYELLTLTCPYEGLGGQAGQPEFAPRMRDKLVPPSKLSPDRGRLPSAIWRQIDLVVTRGLAFVPDDRFATPDQWITELDRVYAKLTPEAHLTPLNARMTRVVDWLTHKLRLFPIGRKRRE